MRRLINFPVEFFTIKYSERFDTFYWLVFIYDVRYFNTTVLRGADDKVVGKLLVYRKYGEVVA